MVNALEIVLILSPELGMPDADAPDSSAWGFHFLPLLRRAG